MRSRRAGFLTPAGVLLLLASGLPTRAAGPDPVMVTISDKGCDPAAVTVGVGKSVFKIKNTSRRAVEWEILKGVNVVEERENIIPGFVQTITATLEAGDYAMTCGLLSNPKGTLTVATGPSGAATPVSPLDLVGPLAEYKVYVTRETEVLVAETRRFADAVKAGKLEEAKALYAPARQHYERIEPIAELFSDLDASLDSREDDFEKKAEDPAFTGFHRIEKGLFADGATAGLEPVADKLLSDVTELQARVTTLVITPKSLAGGAAGLIEEVASKKISGEEDRYSRTDLWDFQANLDGAQKIVSLLTPLVARQKPDLAARVADNFGKVDDILKKYRLADGGFQSYEQLSTDDRNRLRGPVTVLAEDLSTFRGTLGIE